MRRKTPQEKKRLSYAKDRREAYGQNDKASRRILPRKRALASRANRHRAHQVLLAATGTADAERSDAVEQELRGRRPKRFRKVPGAALGDYVQWRLERRSALGG